MDLNQVILHQAVEAVRYIERARRPAIRRYKQLKSSLKEEALKSLYFKIEKTDRDLEEDLSLTAPICDLYASQFHEEPQRYTRVLSLVAECHSKYLALIEACALFDIHRDEPNTDLEYAHFSASGRSLELAIYGLKALDVFNSRVATSNVQDTSEEFHQTSAELEVKTSQAQRCPELIEDYLRPRLRYEGRRQAVELKPYLTQIEIRSIVLEDLKVPFQRLSVDTDPHVHSIDSRLRRGTYTWYCDSINAVKDSLAEKGASKQHTHSEWLKLYLAATSSKTPNLLRPARYEEEFYLHPVALAKGMRTIGLVVGFIFYDDTAKVVWPLGKASSGEEQEVVVYCHGRTYQGVKLVEAEHASINLSPHDTKSAVSQTQPGQPKETEIEQFAFLKLPPELRNRVYTEYLASESLPRWNAASSCVYVPAICRTSRQLLAEILPMHLEKVGFSVEFKRGRHARKRMPLIDRPALRGLVRFQEIRFEMDLNCIRLCLVKGAPGFTLEFEVQDENHVLLEHKENTRFKEFVQTLLEDANGEGFELAEIATIYEFIYEHTFRHRRQSKKSKGK